MFHWVIFLLFPLLEKVAKLKKKSISDAPYKTGLPYLRPWNIDDRYTLKSLKQSKWGERALKVVFVNSSFIDKHQNKRVIPLICLQKIVSGGFILGWFWRKIEDSCPRTIPSLLKFACNMRDKQIWPINSFIPYILFYCILWSQEWHCHGK